MEQYSALAAAAAVASSMMSIWSGQQSLQMAILSKGGVSSFLDNSLIAPLEFEQSLGR